MYIFLENSFFFFTKFFDNYLKKKKCDKTEIVTKLNSLQNSHCDKTQIVTKLKLLFKK